MLPRNGDIGVCLVVRPGALGLRIGKNDSRDTRVSEEQAAHIKTFAEVLEPWKRASDEPRRQGKPETTFFKANIPLFRQYA